MSTEYSIWREQQSTNDIKQANTERTEIITVEKKKIDKFVQQNSPVNNELIRNVTMNDLYDTYVDGQLKMITSVKTRDKRGKSEAVYTLCSLSYDEQVDVAEFNTKGRFQLTAYDRRVYNAIGTLFLNGKNTISLNEIYSIMTGYSRTNPNSKQLEAIEKSLKKMQNINVFIDLTNEVKAHMIEDKDALIEAGILKDHDDNIKSVVIDDKMLHYKTGTITSEKGKVFKSIQIIAEPSILTYNRAKKTLLSIPMEYIGIEAKSATDKTIAFQDYLLMRIFSYKNKKLHENKVLYDTLYRDSGIEKPKLSKDFIRDRETITTMMDEWKTKGLITDFAEVKEGRSYTGIIFYLDENEKLEGKKTR